MHRFSLLLALFCLGLFACGDGLEPMEETDALGFRSAWTVHPETKLKEGELKEYDPRGKLMAEAFYREGELDGQRRVYWPNGQLRVLENYAAGEFAGDYFTYDSLGVLVSKGQYIDGAMNKAWYLYYPDGKVKEVVTFVDNEENGPFREWYPDGKPKASGNYRDGDNEDGLLHLYAETGGLERVMRCSLKMCNTIWTPDSTALAPEAIDMTMPALAKQ